MPLHVTGSFAAVAIVLGILAARDVADGPLLPRVPGPDASLDESLRVFEPGGALTTAAANPSIGWVLAAGFGVAVVYALSILVPRADVAFGRILSAAFQINAVALAVNILPVRALDGGHLLLAARLWRARRGRGSTSRPMIEGSCG